jgi:aminoglycoside phosphotransferase
VLVAKLSRLVGDDNGLEREAAHLAAIHRARPSGFDSIPRLVAFEPLEDRRVLVQSALDGEPLVAASLRDGDRQRWGVAVLDWLLELPTAHPSAAGDWYSRLIAEPLGRFRRIVSGPDAEMVEETLERLEPLRAAQTPLVFEHGDLSHPNLIRIAPRRIGVIDWELAEETGLPAHDLFFFTAWAAAAAAGARERQGQIAAFDTAFFADGAWGWELALAYAKRLRLDATLLPLLLIACWARYTAGVAVRVVAVARRDSLEQSPDEAASAEAAAALRFYPYLDYWRHALARQTSVGGIDRSRR